MNDNKNTRRKTAVILLTAAAAFTAVIFLVPFDRNRIFRTAYIFEILELIIQVPALRTLFFKEKKISGRIFAFPVFRVKYTFLWLQTGLSVILIILSQLIKIPFTPVLTACLLLLACSVICILAADIARDMVTEIDNSKSVSTSRFSALRARSALLPTMTDDAELKKALNSLAEDIRFSDPVSSPSTETIEQQLESSLDEITDELKTGNADINKINSLKELLSQRNQISKTNK